MRIDHGEIGILVSLAEAGHEDVGAIVAREIDRLKSELVSPDELHRAMTELTAQFIYAQDSPQTLARIFGDAAALGLAPQDVLDWPSHIRAVSAEEVREAVRDFFDVENSITGYLERESQS